MERKNDELSEKNLAQIKEFEENGIEAVCLGPNGQILYQSKSTIKEVDPCKLCNGCKHLIFQDDPDPWDWFRDDDQKALCNKGDKPRLIAGGLEYREIARITIPYWCTGKEIPTDNPRDN